MPTKSVLERYEIAPLAAVQSPASIDNRPAETAVDGLDDKPDLGRDLPNSLPRWMAGKSRGRR